MNGLDKTWNRYRTILIIQAFHSLKAWFLWWLPETRAPFVFAFFSLVFLMMPQLWNFRDTRRIGIASLIFVLFLHINGWNIIFSLLTALSLIPLVFLKDKYLIDLLERFQRIITMILSISLFFWIGHLLGFDLPSYSITYGMTDRGHGLEVQYYFDNHVVFLVNNSWLFVGSLLPSFMRFSSVFIEPGYLAILMVFLLVVNKFDFKNKRNVLYVGVIIATISLAGFLMGIFAYAAYRVQDSRKGFISLCVISMLLLFGYTFFRDYNNGDNFVNNGIIERLEYDNVEGNIAGYNRTTQLMDDQFEEFIKTSDVLMGLGGSADLSFGVGYKKYIMKYGLFGLILFLIYMIKIARIGGNYSSYLLFSLYILMFLRGDSTMFWHGFMLVYICGIMLKKYDSFNDEKNSTHIATRSV